MIGAARALAAIFLLSAGLFTVTPVLADNSTQQVLVLVNSKRAQQNLGPLAVSAELTNAAQAYAVAMAQGGFFSHTSPNGSTFISRDEAGGYTGWSYLEENLAAGQTSPDQAVSAWLNSPEHRANLLSGNVRETGIGFAYNAGSPYRFYWVQEFGIRPSVNPASQALSTPSAAPVSAATAAAPSVAAAASWQAPTGRTVSGSWLAFLRAHGDVDNLGMPRTDVIADPTAGGQTVQFFQRLILEYHPENSGTAQIEPRLLGDLLYPGADAPLSTDQAPPGPSTFFPFSPDQPTGLGHFVANVTADGRPTYFKDYFDSHGGVSAFGYPKEEPKLRNGIWTQRFQAAVFQYHPENDVAGYAPGTTIPLRAYRVQLELLGDEYIQAHGLSYS
jgi:uncharacterized protein YkwD